MSLIFSPFFSPGILPCVHTGGLWTLQQMEQGRSGSGGAEPPSMGSLPLGSHGSALSWLVWLGS